MKPGMESIGSWKYRCRTAKCSYEGWIWGDDEGRCSRCGHEVKFLVDNITAKTSPQKYEVSILETCEELHMTMTGASEGMSANAFRARITYLEKRLGSWHRSRGSEERYDEAVRALMLAVLAEYDNRRPF